MTEPVVDPIEYAKAVKFADKVIDELHEIEEKIDELGNYELALFLHNTLKSVIIALGGESILEEREAG